MELNEYQKNALSTWGGEEKLIRAFLGIAGEGGELSEIMKKHLRGDFDIEEVKHRTFKELGDILFYVAITAHELGFELNEIAKHNNDKLAKRMMAGTIKGDGEDR